MLTEELVPLTAITASTSKLNGSPKNLIMEETTSSDKPPSSWQPEDNDEEPYVEIQFKDTVLITSIITKGGENGEFASEFKIKSSTSNEIAPQFITIPNPDSESDIVEIPKVYQGNSNDITEVKHTFTPPILMSVVQIYPIRSEPNKPISMQINLKGCSQIETTTVPAIAETTTTKVVTITTPPVASASTAESSVATTKLTTPESNIGSTTETTVTVTEIVTPIAPISTEKPSSSTSPKATTKPIYVMPCEGNSV